jgi:hypothetical protein
VCWCAAAFAKANDAKLSGARGTELVKKGDYKAALTCFTQAVAANPGEVNNQYGLGLCAAQLRQSALAMSSFSKVVVMTLQNNTLNKQVGQLLSAQYKCAPYSCVNTGISPPGLVRWHSESMPIKVFIADGKALPAQYTDRIISNKELATLDASIKNPQFISTLKPAPSYKSEYRQYANAGLGYWSWAASERLISYEVVGDPRVADVVVFWCENSYNNGATAYTRTAPGGPAVYVLLPVSCLPAGLDHISAKNVVANFMAHEFGRALGLQHSAGDSDVMFADYGVRPDPRARQCSNNDKQTLRTLYSLPAAVYFNSVAPRKTK